MRAAGVLDLPGQQVLVEPGLVDRVDRAEAHGHRGELPEVRHQPRVRVGRQPAARVGQFLAEAVQLVLAQPALQERAGVDARRRVALEEDLVAGLAVVLAVEEVVEADLVQAGGRGVGGDVPADAEARPVGPGHHDRGVPPDVGPDPALDVLVAGEPGLALRRDRVDEVGAAQAGHPDLLLAGPLQQAQHHVPGPGTAAGAHHAVEGIDPVPGLLRVDIRQLRGQPVADDRETLASGSHGLSSPSGGRAAVRRHVRRAGRRVAARDVHELSRPILVLVPRKRTRLPGGNQRPGATPLGPQPGSGRGAGQSDIRPYSRSSPGASLGTTVSVGTLRCSPSVCAGPHAERTGTRRCWDAGSGR